MRRTRWTCLVWGLFFSTTFTGSLIGVGCQNVPLDEPVTSVAQVAVTAVTVTQMAPSPTLPLPGPPTAVPLPSPSPTTEKMIPWTIVGQEANSLQFAIPPHWVNLLGGLSQESLATSLGVMAALAVDSARTGAALLAGKSIGTGGVVVGLVAPADVPPSVPVAGLGLLLAGLGTAVTPLSDITTLQAGDLQGATIDVSGMPVPVYQQAAAHLRTRIVYFLAPDVLPDRAVQVVLLFSAAPDHWTEFEPTFARISETAVLPNFQAGLQIPQGTLRLFGTPPTETQVSGVTVSSNPEIWLMKVEAPAYLTLTATPSSPNLDLAISLISPTGNLLNRLNNGFTGDSEKVTDLPLPAAGLHLFIVNNLTAQSGRYTLEMGLSAEPSFSGEGRIAFGEGVQSQLAAESQHVWRFEGTAGQYINVVLQPRSDQLDAILNLYSPDGLRLVALDEGFSGDPEIISGFQLPFTGEYAIRVSSFASAGGTYTISLSQGRETTANFFDAGDLMVGQEKRETLRTNEAHAWFFAGKRDEEMIIRVVPLNNDLDLDIWLLDPNIARLAEQDLFLAGEPEMLQYRLPEDGQYLILVRDFSGKAGGYEIALDRAPTAVPVYEATLASSLPVTGTLPAAQTSFWLFNGQEGNEVTILLEPQDLLADLVLILQAPNGDTVLRVDSGGSGEAEIIDLFTLTATGQWRILVQEFFAAAAPYTLTATWE